MFQFLILYSVVDPGFFYSGGLGLGSTIEVGFQGGGGAYIKISFVSPFRLSIVTYGR